jgi:hypothetical protein
MDEILGTHRFDSARIFGNSGGAIIAGLGGALPACC